MRGRRRAGALLTAVTLAIAGCGGEGTSGAPDRGADARDGGAAPSALDPGILIRDSSGIRIVEIEGSVLDRLPRWHLTEQPILTIGKADGAATEAPYLFTVVGRVAPLGDGTLAVIDRDTNEIRVFDSAGVFVRKMGGEGDGPGEFRGDPYLHPLGQDSLMVFEPSRSRVTVLDGAGAVVETLPKNTACPSTCGIEGFLSDGTPVFYREEQRRPTEDMIGTSLPGRTIDVGVRGSDGTYVPAFSTVGPPEKVLRGRTGVISSKEMLAGSPWFAPGSSQFAVAFRDRFEVVVFDGRGAIRHIVRVKLPPIPITAAEAERVLTNMSSPTEGLQVAEFRPFIGRPYYGEGDDLWVPDFTYAELTGEDAPRLWTIFDSEGLPVARLEAHRIPGHFLNVLSNRDQYRATTADELGVQRLAIYGVVKDSGPN